MSDDEIKPNRPPSSSRAPSSRSSRAPPPADLSDTPAPPKSRASAGSKAPSSSSSRAVPPTTTLQSRDTPPPPPPGPKFPTERARPSPVIGTPRVPMSMMPLQKSSNTGVNPRVPRSYAPGVRPSPPPPSSPQYVRAPTTTLQGRDAAPPPPATMLLGRDPAPSAPATMLLGRDSVPPSPATMLMGRDQPVAPEPYDSSSSDNNFDTSDDDDLPLGPPPASMFKGRNDDLPPLPPSVLRSIAPPSVSKSVLTTPQDHVFAAKQLDIENMDDTERAWQEDWAYKQLMKTSNCPEKYDWIRVPGGYQCEGGGHGVSDFLLAEGKGGILATRSCKWELMEGPYYPNPNGEKDFIRGVLRPATPPVTEDSEDEKK